MYANWSAVCYTWESSKVYSWSILARSLSSLSGPRVGTEDDGWAEVSRAVVNLSITSLLLNMIPWYWRHTSSEAFDMSCAYSHYVCTNKIVSLYHSKTTQKFKPWLCNEAHYEWGEWHGCSRVLLLNALLQKVEDVSTYINLFVSKETVQKDCPWSGQCRQISDWI